MIFDSDMRPERPVPALVGNGTLVTALGRLGCHDSDTELSETQEFVMAGRRASGPMHELLPLGRLYVDVSTGLDELVSQSQQIDTGLAEVRTRRQFRDSVEVVRSLVLAHKNVFLVERRIGNHSNDDLPVTVRYQFRFGLRDGKPARGLEWTAAINGAQACIDWNSHDNVGSVTLCSQVGEWLGDADELQLVVSDIVSPGDELVVRLAITFSDRMSFCAPVVLGAWDEELARHSDAWRDFWSVSELTTGDELVDPFREISLYTLACQATPWSIPPTVTERYWGAGAFHDEWYPFMALLSGGWTDLAERIPRARLATLSRAMRRARMMGALYPWSSTEDGEERDPHGHWYSERFHLGQIVGTVWNLWLYERRVELLDELYPILRECARYFEHNMLARDSDGNLKTIPCTDFDESVGEVEAGPMTMAAASSALACASEAARRLDVDREFRVNWDRLSRELQDNFVTSDDGKRYVVPGEQPQHISCLGYAVPFGCDLASELIRQTFRFFAAKLTTEYGFKPGLSSAFDGTSWMWTAGHLALCAAALGDANGAWEAIRGGPKSAGQFLSPNEHLVGAANVKVPWFTTGCGAWVAGLHWMFARVDGDGDYLLMGVPESLTEFSFRGLRLSRGVTVSARVSNGTLTYLSLLAPQALNFSFEVPARFVEGVWAENLGRVYDLIGLWRVQLDLSAGENQLI